MVVVGYRCWPVVAKTTLVVTLAAGLTLFSLASAGTAYQDGEKAYKAQDYPTAVRCFVKAAEADPKNPKIIFYMGNALARMGKTEEARQAFEMVIQMTGVNDPLGQKASRNVAVITGAAMAQAGNTDKAMRVMSASSQRSASSQGAANYLSHVISNGKIVRFSKKTLSVYIEPPANVPGYKPEMKSLVSNAMSTWSSATGGVLRFTLVPSQSKADIVVRWQKNFSDNILGVSPYQFVGDTLIRSDVSLATYYPGGQVAIPWEELKATVIHELGHAIGLKGHSPYPEDIMYYASNNRPNPQLSARDKATIRALYKFEADVSNAQGASSATIQAYYELYRKGLEAQRAGKIPTAKQYYRQAIAKAPGQGEARFNLGALLINEGNAAMKNNQAGTALGSYREAVQLFEGLQNSGSKLQHIADNLAVARKNLSLAERLSRGG
ncbi:MAG: tetratricopeptide repeat protein [Candidatus Melainabacteria bacterium]